jgi:hypothetical protein
MNRFRIVRLIAVLVGAAVLFGLSRTLGLPSTSPFLPASSLMALSW